MAREERALAGEAEMLADLLDALRRDAALEKGNVRESLARIQAELAEIPGLDASDLPGSLLEVLDDEEALGTLARRESSPLAAIEVVRHLLFTVDVDREDEAQPVMPLARISVT